MSPRISSIGGGTGGPPAVSPLSRLAGRVPEQKKS
jgi:hypothetical protein